MNNTWRESGDHAGCTQQPPVVNCFISGVGVAVGDGTSVGVGLGRGVDVAVGNGLCVGMTAGAGVGLAWAHEAITQVNKMSVRPRPRRFASRVFIMGDSNRAARPGQNC